MKRKGSLRPAAVIPVDLFGSPADYPTIHAIARKENLFVLADGAQGFGGRLGDRWVGNLAPATATSFFPGKSLGAYGDAGAILAQDLSALGTELAGRVSLTSWTATNNVATATATFGAGVSTGSLVEAGLFDAASNGTMLARVTFSVVNKAAGDSLTITWTVTAS